MIGKVRFRMESKNCLQMAPFAKVSMLPCINRPCFALDNTIVVRRGLAIKEYAISCSSTVASAERVVIM